VWFVLGCDATGLPGGVSRSLLVLPAITPSAQDATGLPGGVSRSLLVSRLRASRWHVPPKRRELGFISYEREAPPGKPVASSAKRGSSALLAYERETPPGKPVASSAGRRELGFISCDREAPPGKSVAYSAQAHELSVLPSFNQHSIPSLLSQRLLTLPEGRRSIVLTFFSKK